MRQGSACDVRSWELLGLKTPKQPDSVSCGVCVLIIIQLMATKGVGALYELNRQCEELRASGPLPQGATEVVEGATEEVGRKVQWTGRAILFHPHTYATD